MKNSKHNVIIIGIGNDGRQDDGLGWAFLELVENENPDADIEYRFQLQIEDAELISQYEYVVFVDATEDKLKHGFHYKLLEAKHAQSYSTHAIPPSNILGLCQTLYNKNPTTHLLAISGFEWALQTGLTSRAKHNLRLAFEFFKSSILSKNVGMHHSIRR